ncbi:MAG: response regulator transcription factor [Chloroflexota bacterium]
MRIRVMIVDDHPGMRMRLGRLLQQAPDIEVVGEAADGPSALHRVGRLDPDIMLLDIEMPGMSGIEVTRALRDQSSRVSVLAVSAHNDRHYIVRLLDSGAAGFIAKDDAPDALVEAVRQVARGRRGLVVNRQQAHSSRR